MESRNQKHKERLHGVGTATDTGAKPVKSKKLESMYGLGEQAVAVEDSIG